MTTYNLPLFSTCASSVSYDDQAQVMTVTYRGSGKSYRYQGVPMQVYQGLLNSSSTGQYINRVIKNYPYS